MDRQFVLNDCPLTGAEKDLFLLAIMNQKAEGRTLFPVQTYSSG